FVSVNAAFATVSTVTLPKSWVADETINCGPVAPVEAVRTTGSGVLGPPLKLKVPCALPLRLLPLYQIMKLDFCPGCRASGNCRPEMENSVPEMLALVSVTTVLLLFTTAAAWEACLPTPTFPKSKTPG